MLWKQFIKALQYEIHGPEDRPKFHSAYMHTDPYLLLSYKEIYFHPEGAPDADCLVTEDFKLQSGRSNGKDGLESHHS